MSASTLKSPFEISNLKSEIPHSALRTPHSPLASKSNPITNELHLAKYIIVSRDGREYPILFPAALQHSEMLSPHAGRPVSAGFYQIITADLLLVGGTSTTLNLNPREQDAEIIRRSLITIPE